MIVRVAPLFLNLGIGWTVIAQLHAPAALPFGKEFQLLIG